MGASSFRHAGRERVKTVFTVSRLAVLPSLLAASALALAQAPIQHYTAMAEASAAAVLDAQHFIVAEDECNVLRIYRKAEGQGSAAPVGLPVDLRRFLRARESASEAASESASDLEGAARLGDVIYWISSHSRTANKGKFREGRHRFFATVVETTANGVPTVRETGQPYTQLLRDLVDAPALKDLKLGRAAERRPEDPDGFNIEGLAATPDGSLLIGFRNPLREGKAILVPLANPAEVINGSTAVLGSPILLDLDGRGVRSMARFGDEYVIVAGPVADHGSFALYRWSGRGADAPRLHSHIPSGTHAEAVLVVDSGGLMLLSDDGARQPEAACGGPGKEAQSFRAVRVQVN